jgi:hypothetical protein
LRLGRGLLPVRPGEDDWHRAAPCDPPDVEKQPGDNNRKKPAARVGGPTDAARRPYVEGSHCYLPIAHALEAREGILEHFDPFRDRPLMRSQRKPGRFVMTSCSPPVPGGPTALQLSCGPEARLLKQRVRPPKA